MFMLFLGVIVIFCIMFFYSSLVISSWYSREEEKYLRKDKSK